MNFLNTFVGRVAATVSVSGAGDRAVAKIVLIRNEYAGKDKTSGEIKERTVSIQFTAFRSTAEMLAKHIRKGDQLIVTYRIENNIWTDNEGVERFGYNFIIDGFEFGAPGQAKREELNATRQTPVAPAKARGAGKRTA